MAAAEQKTQTTQCPRGDPVVVSLPWQTEVYVAAANTINLEDVQTCVVGSALPGLDLERGRTQDDGSVELVCPAPRTVTLVAAGSVVGTPVVAQNVCLMLRPSHAPSRPRPGFASHA